MGRIKAPACQNPSCCKGKMVRTCVRPAQDGKQMNLPVGWWCPLCGWFMND